MRSAFEWLGGQVGRLSLPGMRNWRFDRTLLGKATYGLITVGVAGFGLAQSAEAVIQNNTLPDTSGTLVRFKETERDVPRETFLNLASYGLFTASSILLSREVVLNYGNAAQKGTAYIWHLLFGIVLTCVMPNVMPLTNLVAFPDSVLVSAGLGVLSIVPAFWRFFSFRNFPQPEGDQALIFDGLLQAPLLEPPLPLDQDDPPLHQIEGQEPGEIEFAEAGLNPALR